MRSPGWHESGDLTSHFDSDLLAQLSSLICHYDDTNGLLFKWSYDVGLYRL